MGILEISTVVGCKVNCASYCPQATHVREYEKRVDSSSQFVMTLEDFETCLEKLPKDVEIHFAGMAEPFLNPYSVDMILRAARSGRTVSVYSTLVGLDPLSVLMLGVIDFKEFVIHVPDDAGLMHVNVDDEYVEVLSRCIKVIENHHFTCIGKPHPRLAPLLPKLNDDTPGLISRASNLKQIPRKLGPIRCSAVEGDKLEHNVLLPNCDVCLCCCDYSLKAVIGNLLRDSYGGLFESAEYKRMKQAQLYDTLDLICRGCEYAESLGGKPSY